MKTTENCFKEINEQCIKISLNDYSARSVPKYRFAMLKLTIE